MTPPNVPQLVRGYAAKAVPSSSPLPRQVRIRQSGTMWQKPGARPLRFTAVEELAVEEVAFSWRARFPILRFLSMRIVDRFAAGEGLLAGRLLGLPVLQRSGPELDDGEALRYLAELPWVPHAMVANQALEWRDLDDRTVEVATQVGPSCVAARIEFDAGGDVVGSAGDARPRAVGKQTVPTPWAGTFSSYAVFEGVRVPTEGEARWELPEGPFTYWRGVVESLELVYPERR